MGLFSVIDERASRQDGVGPTLTESLSSLSIRMLLEWAKVIKIGRMFSVNVFTIATSCMVCKGDVVANFHDEPLLLRRWTIVSPLVSRLPAISQVQRLGVFSGLRLFALK